MANSDQINTKCIDDHDSMSKATNELTEIINK